MTSGSSLERSHGQPTIARIWRGAIRSEDSPSCRLSLGDDLMKVRSYDGNLGALVLERAVDRGTEFLFVSLWQSMDDVARFAGTDIDRAVYFRDDRRVLLELAPRVDHYLVVEADIPHDLSRIQDGGSSSFDS